ncbi:hypothetical protein EPUS_02058 [Endocarpon pusillum Z07020]|uniref:Uncharacterized protein n=1 Tax=Endocarpon pusillum (strain Z07020 / HMAS-L-300199) TaxID=1263415 RepID=U1GQW8_ENDPU|nr:uncharacterized protein EPUS_02058 [Endocarpon pusillum Z07020]ERF74371.1 hypothetical protein EPUS_02058 [Endocarpon pusillum Z07020]
MTIGHERFFVRDIDDIAHNRAKIDAMCAFYFAAAHNRAFNNLAHKHLKQLERQCENLYVSQMEENLCTSLLQAHDRAELLQETQNAAQRLQLALSRVTKGDKHLPPWGPPLLSRDRPIEQVKEWTFPLPWTIIHDKDPKLYIKVAIATPWDPRIHSEEAFPSDAAELGVLPPTAVPWGVEKVDTAPATVACEAIARAGAALATAASSARVEAGVVPTRATSRRAAQVGGVWTAPASSSPARVGASQAVTASRGAARAVGYPATAAPVKGAGLDKSPATAAGSILASSMPLATAAPGVSAGAVASSTAEALRNKVRTSTALASAMQRTTIRMTHRYTPPTTPKSTENPKTVPSLATAGAVGIAAQTDAATGQRAVGSTARSGATVKAASAITARGCMAPAGGRSESPPRAGSSRASMPRQRQEPSKAGAVRAKEQELKATESQSSSPSNVRSR